MPLKTLRLLPLAAAVLLAGCAAPSATGGMTSDQADAILAELKDIKRMLVEQRPKPAEADAGAPSKVQLDDVAPDMMGAADAPVTLIEFTDYQCPFCKRFHERSWPELKAKYVDTGKVRFVVRDLPLSFHSQALPAAIAARCAGQQGHFAAVFEALFAAPELSAAAIRGVVARAGVAGPAYEKCAANPAVRQAIDADTAEAERLGINGTPGFVIAQRSGGRLEGTLVVGAQPTNVFSSRLDALLAAPRAN
jgi:protein-disulfide isomerase